MLYSILVFSPSINDGVFISSNRFDTNSNSYRLMLRVGSSSCVRGIVNTNGNLRLNILNMLNVNIGVLSRNFLHAGKNRMFSSRSAVALADKENSASKELSLISSVCEVPQAAHFKKAKSFLNNYKGRIDKSSNNVKQIFSLLNMAKAYYEFDSILHECNSLPYGKCISLPIYQLLCNPCYLLIAYSSLKFGPSSEVDDVPVNNITLANINSIAKRLVSHQYFPKPTKRLFIRKNNGKMRSLGISSTQDKIVQQAIILIFNHLFEPIFLNCSHGFRPKRGCHSALKTIYFMWKRPKWFIKIDISQCFDKMSHPTLLLYINKRLNDYWLSILINRFLKAGFIHFEGLTDSQLVNKVGTPQGSILSPLFCNILLHEYDVEVRNFIYSINTTRNKRVSAAYRKATSRYVGSEWEQAIESVFKLTPGVNKQEIRKHFKRIRVMNARNNSTAYLDEDPNYRKLQYVRYADDFLLSFIGPKSEAAHILKILVQYLWYICKLEVNTDKVAITHHKKWLMFLGYKIKGHYDLNVKWDKERGQRKGGNSLKLGIPLERLFNRFAERGFFQKARKGKATKLVAQRQDKWLFMSSVDIVRRYNAVIRGISNYYSLSTQQSVLYELFYTLRRSCALTLAHKHKKKYAK